MNKMYKVLATATILAMAALPITASAQSEVPAIVPIKANVETAVPIKGSLETAVPIKATDNIVPIKANAVAGTMGLITNFVNDQTGKFVTVTGRGLTATEPGEIVLAITKDTKIIDSKGKRVQLKDVVDQNKAVKAFYGPAVTMSLPARGTALTLVVQDQMFTGTTGTVTEVSDSGVLIEGTNVYTKDEEKLKLHFDKKAIIIDQNGKSIKAGDIQEGMQLKAFYVPAVTMSLPPQAITNFAIVDTEVKLQVEQTGTTGIVTDMEDQALTIKGQAIGDGTNFVKLHVNDSTEIVDETGKKLTLADVKADTVVDGFYSGPMMMSYPGQAHADKIVVKSKQVVKIEGTIQASDFAQDGQIYVNVGADENTNNDIVLNIGESTTVVPADVTLKPGMKIVAYHDLASTRSLPAISNAHFIFVAAMPVAD